MILPVAIRVMALYLFATDTFVNGFRLSPLRRRQATSIVTSVARMPRTALSATDDDIAKLEAQLQQLKEERKSQQLEAPLSPELLERAQRTDMILSEQDLVSGGIVKNDEDDSSFNIGSVVAGIVGLVVILLFSQIPVGQDDLARYSPSTGPKNAATATSIDLGDLNPSKP